MRRPVTLATAAALVFVLLGGLWGQQVRRVRRVRRGRVRITWLEGDMPRAIKLARTKGVPLLLFVRDTFGQGYIDYVEGRWDWDEASLRRQMRRSQTRWRWQRYEEDLFTRPEMADAVKPFVRVRLEVGYRQVDRKVRDLLRQLNLLSDVDLAWRRRLIDDPWEESLRYIDPTTGGRFYDRRLNTTLDELLARETTGVAVVAGDGQLLLRFPLGPPGFEPPLEAWLDELGRVLKPYRTLFDARQQLGQGQVGAAVAVLRELSQAEEGVPNELRRSAQAELTRLKGQAEAGLREAEAALTRDNLARAWEVLSEVSRRGLDQVDAAVAARATSLGQQVEAHATTLYEKAREQLGEDRLSEAFALLSQVARRFKGTQAGSLAQAKVDEIARDPALAEKLRQARRKQEAQRLSSAAQSAEQAEDILKAYRNYKALAQNYADLPLGAQARDKITTWEADADLMARIQALGAEQEARKWMDLAQNYFLNRVYTEAIQYYQKVIDTYPESDLAAQARTRLQEAQRLLEAQLKPQEPAPQGEPEPEEGQ